jgi:hypothetical protein
LDKAGEAIERTAEKSGQAAKRTAVKAKARLAGKPAATPAGSGAAHSTANQDVSAH